MFVLKSYGLTAEVAGDELQDKTCPIQRQLVVCAWAGVIVATSRANEGNNRIDSTLSLGLSNWQTLAAIEFSATDMRARIYEL